MANANSPYTDGDWTIAQQDGRRKESFPFDFLGDAYAKLIERKYRMLGTSYMGPATVNRTSYTNPMTYSNDYGNVAWTKTNVTIISADIANPWNGSITADRLTETTANATHNISSAITLVNLTAGNLIWAVVKKGTTARDYAYLYTLDAAAAINYALFNLTTGTTGLLLADTSGMVSLGNGWWVIWMTFGVGATGGGTATGYVGLSNTNSVANYVGSTSYSLNVAQVQFQPAATGSTVLYPLILTAAAARTVSVPNVDSIDNPSTNGDPTAFLLTETPPGDSDLALGLIAFTRKYGRIPATEVEYTSRFVQRPVMDGAYIAPTYYTASVDNGVTSHIFNTRKAVTTSGAIAADVVSIVATAHGGVAGDIAVLWWGNGLIARTPVLAAAADFFYVARDAVSAPTYACNFAQFTKNALVRYVNGNKNCSIKRSHYFYLPGYTIAGTIAVTTGADIPNYDVYTDPTLWLGRIVPTAAAATYAAIEVSAIGYYEGQPGSPVLTQVVDEAQMSDALDSIPV